MTDETIAAVETAATDVRKEAENTAKQHINTIWQSIETWTKEHIEAFIADIKKHL